MAPLPMEAGSRPPSKVRELDGRVEFRKIDFIEQATGEKHAGKKLRRVVGSSFLLSFLDTMLHLCFLGGSFYPASHLPNDNTETY